MIVASHTKGWKIITQRSHGLLAAMLAYQYDIDLPNEILVPTLIAIAEHDDGIAETLAHKNLTEAGAPRHFLVDDDSNTSNLEQQFNVMEKATAKSQINALMTSMHIDFIFDAKKGGPDKNLNAFLKSQEKNRKDILKHLDIDTKYATYLYRFVEWCDAFSLLICMDKIQPEGRKMEISNSPSGKVHQTFYQSENVISVDPWPFKNDTFKVFYEFKVVEQLKFKSMQEFDAVFSKTQVQRQEFVLQK